MKKRLLAVRPRSRDYNECYSVSFSGSFAEAERMMRVERFDVLDLPAENEAALWKFLKGIRKGAVEICIHGVDDTEQFVRIRDEVRAMGFEFLD